MGSARHDRVTAGERRTQIVVSTPRSNVHWSFGEAQYARRPLFEADCGLRPAANYPLAARRVAQTMVTMNRTLLARCAGILACFWGFGCGPSQASKPTDEAAIPGPTVAPPPAPAAPRPALPADPSPTYPAGLSEVAGYEAKLAANKSFTSIWDPAQREARTILLTGLSQLLSDDGLFLEPRLALDAHPELKNAAKDLFLIFARTGHYPAAFTTATESYLVAVKDEPHLGLWLPAKKGQAPHDFTGLAYWLNPERADYLRELLDARAGGSWAWQGLDSKRRGMPYIADEQLALERLALLETLRPSERVRLAALRDDAAATPVTIDAILAEYKDNEVRADGKFKGKSIRTTGLVGDVKKDVLGDIYVTVGTGKDFELPRVQCFVAKGEEARAAALSHGAKVTIRGTVEGLMMNVLVKSCVIAE